MPNEHTVIDSSVLAEAYERWLRAYQEYDEARQVVLHRSCFRDGIMSTLHLLPQQREPFYFGPCHHGLSSAALHDWFSIGGDLWAAYLAATMDKHGIVSSPEEPEPASITR